MLSVSNAGKNANSASKTSGVLRGGASGAMCWGGGGMITKIVATFSNILYLHDYRRLSTNLNIAQNCIGVSSRLVFFGNNINNKLKLSSTKRFPNFQSIKSFWTFTNDHLISGWPKKTKITRRTTRRERYKFLQVIACHRYHVTNSNHHIENIKCNFCKRFFLI